MTERIRMTEAFLRRKLGESTYFEKHPEAGAYRLEHTFRVARIGREIAQREGFDTEYMTMACLLHDVGYCREFTDQEDWRGHGRESARIARPFLLDLGVPAAAVEEICFGIAIHVDDRADFDGERTPFALTIGDADNIDRFDAYRLYETLETIGFSKLSLADRRAHVEKTLPRLTEYLGLPFATASATELWRERIGFYLDFYRRLSAQLSASAGLGGEDEPLPGGAAPDGGETLLGLAGRS